MIALLLLSGLVAVGAFFVASALGSNTSIPASGSPPGAEGSDPTPSLTETPHPNSTPDTSQPGWFIPYVTADAALPAFTGEVNGILVGDLPAIGGATVDPAAEGLCTEPEVRFGPEAEQEFLDSRVAIPAERLPDNMRFFETPRLFICEATNTRAEAVVQVVNTTTPGPLGSGSIMVARFVGDPRAGVLGPEKRWRESEVSGHPAALLQPIIESVGQSALIVHEPDIRITTMLVGQGVYAESLIELMQELLR